MILYKEGLQALFYLNMKKNLDISVVIPVFNEEESLVELNNQILNSIDKSKTYELIYINDGST